VISFLLCTQTGIQVLAVIQAVGRKIVVFGIMIA
jgi:hypothetical protein